MELWQENSIENLIPLPTRTSFKIISRSSGFSQKLFPQKWSLVNIQPKKKNGKRKQKKRTGEKAKSKSRGTSETFQNFAFCVCPNFELHSNIPRNDTYVIELVSLLFVNLVIIIFIVIF